MSLSSPPATLEREAPEQTRYVPSRLGFACLATSLVIITIYNMIFLKKSFPMTEGWFSAYANRVLLGKVPYRDFYLWLPPLYTLQIAAFMRLFGESFLPLRLLGVVVILGITALLYGLYSRLFTGPAACLSTVFAVMLLQSGVAHISYDFYQFVIFYGLAAAFLLLKACDSDDFVDEARPGPRALAWLAGSGVLAGACFLTKQSNGLIIASSLGVGVICVSLGLGLRRAIVHLVAYALGFAVPVLIILAWLLSEGAIFPFFQQVFIGASASKGGLSTILFAWLGMTVDILRLKNGLKLSVIIALITAVGWSQAWVARRLRRGATPPGVSSAEGRWLELLALLAVSTMALVFTYFFPLMANRIVRFRIGWKLDLLGFVEHGWS